MSRPKSEPPRLPIVSFQWRTAEGIAMRLQPKNWGIFQHYKDRSPPWIKLHRDLLINRDFICLPLASKALAPLLWLLASESKDGTFDASFEELQFRLHISKKEYDDGIKPLIDKGFFYIASGMLAECNQVAIPERETEIEKEKEKRQKATVVATPDGVSETVWQEFVNHRKSKKAQITQTVIEDIAKQATIAGWTLEDALKETIVRNWQSFKADWVAQKMSKSAQTNSSVMSGLTRGLIGGGSNVKLLGN